MNMGMSLFSLYSIPFLICVLLFIGGFLTGPGSIVPFGAPFFIDRGIFFVREQSLPFFQEAIVFVWKALFQTNIVVSLKDQRLFFDRAYL